MPGTHAKRWRRLGLRDWILLGGAAVTVALVGLHGLNRLTFDFRFFALDEEQNLPSWVSAVTFAVTGLAWATFGALSRGAKRIAALLVGCLFAAMSLDDVTKGHETLEGRAGEELLVLVVQPLALLPVIALIAWARRYVPSFERLLLIGAMGALVVAQAASAAYTAFDLSERGVLFFLVVEESSELDLRGAAPRGRDRFSGQGARGRAATRSRLGASSGQSPADEAPVPGQGRHGVVPGHGHEDVRPGEAAQIRRGRQLAHALEYSRKPRRSLTT